MGKRRNAANSFDHGFRWKLAPRDGTTILVWDLSNAIHVVKYDGMFQPGFRARLVMAPIVRRGIRMWMPLPEPPSVESADQESNPSPA
jgi:hypothetical protein